MVFVRTLAASLAAILSASSVEAGDLDVVFTPGSTNLLTLSTSADSDDLYLAYESNGVSIGDQINLRYAVGFELNHISAPSGWIFQNITVDETEKVATYYYRGASSSNTAEFYDFEAPASFEFQIRDLSGSEASGANVRMEGELSVFRDVEQQLVTAFLQDELSAEVLSTPLADFRQTYGLSAAGADDFGDASGNGIPNIHYYAFGLGDPSERDVDLTRLAKTEESGIQARFTYTRAIDAEEDGIQYLVESSADLVTWVSISDLPAAEQEISTTLLPLDLTHEMVELRFNQSAEHRFYRLGISVD